MPLLLETTLLFGAAFIVGLIAAAAIWKRS
jgi:hypothetical protein